VTTIIVAHAAGCVTTVTQAGVYFCKTIRKNKWTRLLYSRLYFRLCCRRLYFCPLGLLFLVSSFPKIARTRVPPPRVIIWHWCPPVFLAAKHTAPPARHRNPRVISRRWVAAQKPGVAKYTGFAISKIPPGDQK
jgi:hypothetical protein